MSAAWDNLPERMCCNNMSGPRKAHSNRALGDAQSSGSANGYRQGCSSLQIPLMHYALSCLAARCCPNHPLFSPSSFTPPRPSHPSLTSPLTPLSPSPCLLPSSLPQAIHPSLPLSMLNSFPSPPLPSSQHRIQARQQHRSAPRRHHKMLMPPRRARVLAQLCRRQETSLCGLNGQANEDKTDRQLDR